MLPPQQHDRHRTRGSISDLPPDAGAERPARIAISIVIPARDAAATLDATIGSLLAQRWVEWEAIVVDDGSTDETRTIADAYAARDPRVRVTATGGSGVSAARNAGMALARHPWLLFLDADDTIDPDALERFAGALAAAPEADAAHAGWRYVAPDGTPIGEDRCTSAASDLFALLAARPALAVHACVVRRSVAESAGGWDEALRTSEDFDFWQRIARVGARFVAVPGTLVDYRIRPRGSWLHGEAFLRDRLRAARRGHAPDPRVARADPAHAAGAPAAELPAVEYAAVAWAAGIALTAGEDPVALLEQVAAGAPDVRPTWMAEGLFRSVPLALCRDATCWRDRWPAFAPRIAAFLEATEARAGVRGLARRTETALERWIVDALAGAEPIAPQAARIEAPVLVGATAGVRLDLGAPLPDVRAPGMGRLVIAALLGERSLGAVLVPVCDDLVPRAVLADAIAAEHAWAVLGSHLERHVHPMLSMGDADGTGRAIRRGDTLLSARPAADESLHDAIGWELFEQELFGAPTWTDARFYDPTCPLPSDSGTIAAATGEPVAVELSAPLPAISSIGDAVDVELLVGGASLGMVRVAAEQGTIGSGALRVALLMAGGMELCRVVVREALVGWPGDDATPLRARLAARAGAAAAAADRPFAL
ncbi:MAG: glycosyltransferase family 2 protein, partial [bacterium]